MPENHPDYVLVAVSLWIERVDIVRNAEKSSTKKNENSGSGIFPIGYALDAEKMI